MPPEEYARDFPDSVGEFNDLLTHPQTLQRIIIPWATQQDRDEVQRRTVQYLLAGVYVARHSQILIALWDGVESEKLGGTAQIVAFKRTGRLELSPALSACLQDVPEPHQWQHSPLDPFETGPIYHIHTPRRSTPDPTELQGCKRLAPDDYKGPEKQAAYFARIAEIYGHISTLKVFQIC